MTLADHITQELRDAARAIPTSTEMRPDLLDELRRRLTRREVEDLASFAALIARGPMYERGPK